jgi:ATP-binding cassette subfamily B protein RaxB
VFMSSATPTIHQSEAAECGLACIAMVLGFHGYKTDLSNLRRRFPVSLKGATLAGLVAVADKVGFSCRPLRIDLEEISSLTLPTILHWDMNHFVVLVKQSAAYVIIHDPAKGKVKISKTEVSKHLTGIALELRPAPHFEQKVNINPVRLTDFWSRIRGLKRNMIQVFLLSGFLQLFTLATPLYQQMVVDDAITKRDADFLLVLSLGFALMGLMNLTINHLRSYVMLYFSNTLSFQMSINLFRHLLRLPLEFFEKRSIGDITSRFGSLDPIKSLFINGIVSVVLDGIMAIGTLAMALLYSWKLTAVIVAFLLVGFLINLIVYPIKKRMSEDILNIGAKEQTNFLETIRAARAIKVFGQEVARETQWQNLKANTINANLKLDKFNINMSFATGVIGVGQSIITLYIGAQLVISGQMTLGMLFAYQAYSSQFAGRMNALIDQYISFKMLSLHLSRLADILHTKTEVSPAIAQLPCDIDRRLNGSIRVANLSHRYGEHEPLVLDSVSFSIEAGEMVVFVGPSGAGKTTLLKLLIGLLTPQSGEITIDGQTIQDLGIDIYRNNLGVVMQDDQLLTGSIADNISFFDPNVDIDRIVSCAQKARLDTDIEANPMGYNSLVGDMGTSLSGGQRQRLLLARALYRKPQILFLDEGTANLDEQTEQEIVPILGGMTNTRIFIAHRPALIQAADRVFLVADGDVKELKPQPLEVDYEV